MIRYVVFFFAFDRLKTKLQASAAGMNSPEWDQCDRLVEQLAADQHAAVADVVPNSSGSSTGMVSASTARGRSQSRTTRLGTNDDDSRSRSRSFTLPLRGWGGGGGKGGAHGERRRRWASQDSDTHHRGARMDTDTEEQSYHDVRQGSHLSRRGAAGGVANDQDDLEDRPSRNKSFFGGFGKWGSRRRSPVGMQSPRRAAGAGAGDSGDEGTMGRSRGGSAAGIDGSGRGGSRRQRSSSSSAQALLGVVKRPESSSSRNYRVSSLSGERPSATFSDAAESPAPAVTSYPAPQKVTKARTAENLGRSARSHSMMVSHSPTVVPEPAQSARYFGGKMGWGRGKTSTSAAARSAAAATEAGQDVGSQSTGDAPLAETPRNATRTTPVSMPTPGRSRWGRGRVRSSVGVESSTGDTPLVETPRNMARSTPDSMPTPGRRRRGRGRVWSSVGVESGEEQQVGRQRRALSATAATPRRRGGASTFDNCRSEDVSASGSSAVRGAVADGDVGADGGKAKKGVFRRTKGVWGSLQVGSWNEENEGGTPVLS